MSADSGSSTLDGVKSPVGVVATFVESGASDGFANPAPGVRTGLCLFLNVFLAVGDVAERVSSLKLVEPLPKIGLTFDVLSDNFGRFEGDGTGGSVVGTVFWL